MRPQKIKKGRKGILHLPRILKHKTTYTQRIAISHNMFQVSDACDSGWSKLWGISFGHHHWHSSYRFVFRVREGKLILGFYCYVNGNSPQDKKWQKGEFPFDTIHSRDTFLFEIEDCIDSFRLTATNERSRESFSSVQVAPKNFRWLRTELYPNLKCKQKQVTTFQFLK